MYFIKKLVKRGINIAAAVAIFIILYSSGLLELCGIKTVYGIKLLHARLMVFI